MMAGMSDPIDRMGTSEEIAAAVLGLCTPSELRARRSDAVAPAASLPIKRSGRPYGAIPKRRCAFK